MAGLYAGRKLLKKRAQFKIKKKGVSSRFIARATVLSLAHLEVRQPNSGQRACAKVQLLKQKTNFTAFIPRDDASEYVNQHDIVTIRAIGGRGGRSKGDLPSVRYEVFKVNGVSLEELRRGRKVK